MTGKRFLRSLAGLCMALILCGGGADAVAGLKAVEVPPAEDPPPAAQPQAQAPGVVEQTGARDEFYDPSNPAYDRLQRAGEALGGMPLDRDGKVDWMGALRRQAIVPRQRLDGKDRPPPLDLDIIMRNTRLMPNVRFPHRAHTEWLDCSNCHPSPFAEKAGSTQIRMEDIFRGQFCGKCHDRVAFITHRNCYRCHSVNPDGTPALPPAVLPVHPAAPPAR